MSSKSGWLSVCLLGLAALAQLWPLVASRPQVVTSLMQPEPNQLYPNFAPQPPPRRPPRYTARPGNVIVHFDRNHDIQNLQYVLQDGRLATLYQRPAHPENGMIPMQVPIEIHRRDEQPKAPVANQPQAQEVQVLPSQPVQPAQPANAPAAVPQPVAKPPTQANTDQDQSIRILDANQQGVAQLVGDHLTVDLSESEQSGSEEHLESSSSSTQSGQPSKPSGDDEKLDVLATIAVDALAAGAHMGEAKLKKAGNLIDKLKSKVSAKLSELPAIIDRKLKAKSSAGQVFIDNTVGGHSRQGSEEVLSEQQRSLIRPQVLPQQYVQVLRPNVQLSQQRLVS